MNELAPTADPESNCSASEEITPNVEKRPLFKLIITKKVAFIAFISLLLITIIITVFLIIVNHASVQATTTLKFFPHSAEDERRIRSLVDEINGKNLTWKAEYNRFASLQGKTVDEPYAADYSSLKLDGLSIDESINHHILQDTVSHLKELASHSLILPSTFDARDQWPRCSSVHHIQHQGGCGSCWATAATAAISDRLCISSNFTKQHFISTQDLLSCCDYCGRCQGSTATIFPFLYWKRNGIVSGGPLGSNEGCRPYEIESTCGSPCPPYFAQIKFNPHCVRKCQPLFEGDYESDLGRAKSVYFVRMKDHYKNFNYSKLAYAIYEEAMNDLNMTSIELIKREIFLHGPVSMCTVVNEPIKYYRSGIYSESDTIYSVSGSWYGHCMKLIGWGEENGREFWTVANSWGRKWGENGFGKISVDYFFDLTSVSAGLW